MFSDGHWRVGAGQVEGDLEAVGDLARAEARLPCKHINTFDTASNGFKATAKVSKKLVKKCVDLLKCACYYRLFNIDQVTLAAGGSDPVYRRYSIVQWMTIMIDRSNNAMGARKLLLFCILSNQLIYLKTWNPIDKIVIHLSKQNNF